MDGSYCSLFETTDDDILSLDVKSTARCELPSLVDALGKDGIGAEAWCGALKPFVAEKAAVTVVAAADMRQASTASLFSAETDSICIVWENRRCCTASSNQRPWKSWKSAWLRKWRAL